MPMPISKCLWRYRYQGQNIISEIPLAALKDQEIESANGDIFVTKSAYSGSELVENSSGWLIGTDAFGFDVSGAARFVISSGHTISVSPAANASAILIEQIILGTAFAVSMMQRRQFCLHAAVLSRNGLTIAFCGNSGEGKSTLAMALGQAGWKVLTDDLALPELNGGAFFVANDGRHLRLWRESLLALNCPMDGVVRISDSEEKFYIQSPSRSNSQTERLDAICFLESGGAEESFSIQSPPGIKGLALLRQHTYRAELLSLMGCDASHLQFSCELQARIPLFMLKRPRSLERLRQIDKFLMGVDFMSRNSAPGFAPSSGSH